MSLPVTAVTSIVLREHLRPAHWAAVAVVSVGLVLLSVGSGEPGELFTSVWFAVSLWVGVVVLLLAARVGVHWPGSAIAVLAGLGYTGSAVAVRGAESATDIVSIAAGLTVGIYGLIGFWLYSVALDRAPVSAASAPLIVTQTFVPSLIGVAFLGDTRPTRVVARRSSWACCCRPPERSCSAVTASPARSTRVPRCWETDGHGLPHRRRLRPGGVGRRRRRRRNLAGTRLAGDVRRSAARRGARPRPGRNRAGLGRGPPLPWRRAQPRAGRPGAQPGGRLRRGRRRPPTPTATRSPTPRCKSSSSTPTNAARATAPGCFMRSSTPCGPTTSPAPSSGRSPTPTTCGASSPTPAGAADSAHRELDLDGTGVTTVKQVRLHTAL